MMPQLPFFLLVVTGCPGCHYVACAIEPPGCQYSKHNCPLTPSALEEQPLSEEDMSEERSQGALFSKEAELAT